MTIGIGDPYKNWSTVTLRLPPNVTADLFRAYAAQYDRQARSADAGLMSIIAEQLEGGIEQNFHDVPAGHSSGGAGHDHQTHSEILATRAEQNAEKDR